MAILSARGLCKAYGTRELFENVSFTVEENDKIGLVGDNGTGKTTLIKIIEGKVECDSGEIFKQKLLSIASLDQTPDIAPGESLYEFSLREFSGLIELERSIESTNEMLIKEGGEKLSSRLANLNEQYEKEGGLTYKSRVRSALMGLGFNDDELNSPADRLSGGQQSRAMLAKLLLRGVDLLLLDEPTNHLDIRSTTWLEGALKAYKGSYIIISHDRYFLDRVCAKTLELCDKSLYSSNGSYSEHIQKRQTENELKRRHYYNTQREIRRIEGIIEQQKRWGRQRNIIAAESKQKQVERLKKTLVPPEHDARHISFKLNTNSVSGEDCLIVDGLGKSFGDNELFEGVDLHIRKGERVFLLGPNGCGKTTLMRIITGKLSADSGSIRLGKNVEPAFYEQDIKSVKGDISPLSYIIQAYPKLGITQAKSALARFLFYDGALNKTLDMLSGGEKARLQLLRLMLRGANLLLLDEPTNHLDIRSREALETALEEYDGAMLIITHDRYLTNRLADRVLYMGIMRGLEETIGGYDAFLENWSKEELFRQKPQAKQKSGYHIKKEKQKLHTKAKTALRKAQEAVLSQEEAIKKLEDELIEHAHDYVVAGELSEQIQRLRSELDCLVDEWERAENMLESLEEEE